MLTVKQAAAITGVSEATLRAWERRYAVVRPSRSHGGYRLYSDDEITRLRHMAALVAAGMTAGQAATKASDFTPIADPPETDPSTEDALARAARTLDPARLDRVVQDAFAQAPFETVVRDWIVPQIRRLGDEWEAGRVTIAHEHFASARLMRAIGTVFDAAVDASGPEVLVGLPGGDRHEIALFCFATCLRRRGINVAYLGADVPASTWAESATQRQARAVVLGVTATTNEAEAQAAIDLLTEAQPPVGCFVGGSRADLMVGATVLPQDVVAAADAVAVALLAGRS